MTLIPRTIVVMAFMLVGLLAAQENAATQEIPRDTSYTSYSAAVKVYKKFPDVKLVIPGLPEGVAGHNDLVYASYGPRGLHLDLFTPTSKDAGQRPGVIIVHGGGWKSGDRSMLVPMAERLAAHGYVTAAVEYRLSIEALYPAAVYDLKAAVRWMRANAAKYNIDSTRIAVYGCSAGGELVSFLGTTNGIRKFEGNGECLDHSSDVQAVVNVDGLVDFTDTNSTKYDENPDKPSAAHLWIGASYKERPELWKGASPITYVSKKTPPIIFINSSMEHYHAGRDEMTAQLKTLGIYYEVHTLSGTPHTFWLFHPWFETTSNYTVNFLDRTLKGAGMQKP